MKKIAWPGEQLFFSQWEPYKKDNIIMENNIQYIELQNKLGPQWPKFIKRRTLKISEVSKRHPEIYLDVQIAFVILHDSFQCSSFFL